MRNIRSAIDALGWVKAVALLAIGFILGAVFLTMADDPGTIHACVNPAGQVRILAPGDSCRPQESPLNWNETGPPGPAGPQGSPGISGLMVVAEWGPEDSEDSKTHTVWCPEGMNAISGGYNISGGGPNILVRTFHPQGSPPTGWQVSAHEINPTDEVWSIRAVAVCAFVES